MNKNRDEAFSMPSCEYFVVPEMSFSVWYLEDKFIAHEWGYKKR